MTSLLLVIHLVEIWEGAIDGYIWARPEEGCCFQILTCGSDPDLRGEERREEEGNEKTKQESE